MKVDIPVPWMLREFLFIYLWLIYGGDFIDPSLPVIPPEVNVLDRYVFGVQSSYLLTFGLWKPRAILT